MWHLTIRCDIFLKVNILCRLRSLDKSHSMWSRIVEIFISWRIFQYYKENPRRIYIAILDYTYYIISLWVIWWCWYELQQWKPLFQATRCCPCCMKNIVYMTKRLVFAFTHRCTIFELGELANLEYQNNSFVPKTELNRPLAFLNDKAWINI